PRLVAGQSVLVDPEVEDSIADADQDRFGAFAEVALVAFKTDEHVSLAPPRGDDVAALVHRHGRTGHGAGREPPSALAALREGDEVRSASLEPPGPHVAVALQRVAERDDGAALRR